MRELGARNGLTVDLPESASAFTRPNLARYRAVVFLMTTGDVLNAEQQTAFERYFRTGGGFAGIHSAADTEYGWTWYGRLLGTRFRSHPQIQTATVRVERRNDPSTAGLPTAWKRTDEWYNFARNPRASVRVLATLDESSYAPGDGAMGRDHPIAWTHEFQGGRAWFTGGGHTDEAYGEPLFRKHLIGGIRYAAGLSPPQILSIAVRAQKQRVHLTLRYARCQPCRAVLAIGSSRTSRLAGGRGNVTSGIVRRGRRQLTVTLTDPRTGLTDIVRRAVRVR